MKNFHIYTFVEGGFKTSLSITPTSLVRVKGVKSVCATIHVQLFAQLWAVNLGKKSNIIAFGLTNTVDRIELSFGIFT